MPRARRWPLFLSCAAAMLFCSARLATADEPFSELTRFVPAPYNPVFTGQGPGHWDAKIRERGWILREADAYHLWYTGYDGSREGVKRLGYATSPDGIRWTRWPGNPLDRDRWIEDVMVVKRDDVYYMFAEGVRDRAQLLTSRDRIRWTPLGTIDIRRHDGTPIEDGPYGTPTAWYEDGIWRLFYERGDRGVWLAASRDLKVFTNVQDAPVLSPGPEPYDRTFIALNQIVKHKDRYYACYHGSPGGSNPAVWSSNLATSSDLIHWKKSPANPLRPLSENKSSNILVDDGKQFRLYTMHEAACVHFPAAAH